MFYELALENAEHCRECICRGRNSAFTPKTVTVYTLGDGHTGLQVLSKRLGKSAPIWIKLDNKDWLLILRTMLRTLIAEGSIEPLVMQMTLTDLQKHLDLETKGVI